MSASESKTRFDEILERVARGEEIVITHDKPVARIVAEGPPRSAQVERAAAWLIELRDRIRARTRRRAMLSDDKARAAIEQGRR